MNECSLTLSITPTCAKSQVLYGDMWPVAAVTGQSRTEGETRVFLVTLDTFSEIHSMAYESQNLRASE